MYRLRGSCSGEWLDEIRAAIRPVDLAPGPGGSLGSNPQATQAATQFLLRALFPGLTQAIIFGLYPSAQIVGHCDPAISGRRFHVPLETNPQCWSFASNVWEHLPVGTIFELDPTRFHGAVNWGTTRRLHLVIDAETCCGL